MGFTADAPRRVQRQRRASPAPLSRVTENRANVPARPSAVLGLSAAKGDQNATSAASIDSIKSSDGSNSKRRLRPMELKQQQRERKEQRKRAKLSPLPPRTTPVAHDIAATAETAAVAAPGSCQPPPCAMPAPADSADPRGKNISRASHESLAGNVASPEASRRERLSAVMGNTANEPLRRTSSSPPDISCTRQSSGSVSRRRPVGQNTPPRKRPLGLLSVVDDSCQPLLPSSDQNTTNDGDFVVAKGMGGTEGAGRGSSNVGDSGSFGNQVPVGSFESDDFSLRDGQGDDEHSTRRSVIKDNGNEDEDGVSSFRGTSGGVSHGVGAGSKGRRETGAGSPGTSLFSMVMSGASCSSTTSSGASHAAGGVSSASIDNNHRASRDSQAGDGGQEDTIVRRESLSTATTARAEGGVVGSSTTSSLSGMLRGSRRPPQSSSSMAAPGEEGDTIGKTRTQAGGGTNEDWMAMNLDKLLNFRVPETRMGFPEGAREGLKRSLTAPSRSSYGADSLRGVGNRQNVRSGEIPRGSGNAFETPGARKGSPSEHHWQFGSPYPLGQEEQWRLQQQQQSLATVTASTSNNVDGNVNDHNSMDEDNDTQSSPISLCDTRKAGRNTTTTAALDAPAAMDLPLRSRIRFEMAPKIPVPRGISSLPGQVDYRALRDFVAGSDREVSERSQTMARRRGSFHRNAERGSPGANGKSQSDRLVDRDEDGGSVPHRVRSGFDSENNVGVRSKGGVFARAPAAAAKAADDAAKEAAQAREDAMERWRKATLYWAHPASPLPQEALAAQKAAHAQVAKNPAHATRAQGGAHPGGSAASGWASFFWARRRDWEQAFSSLYFGLLSGRRVPCDGSPAGEGFYLQCPRYTVLWRLVPERIRSDDGEDDSSPSYRLVPAAAMTQSTRSLRKRLTAAGVEFTMPLDPVGDKRDAEADEDVLEEWKALGATGNAKPGAVYTNEEDRSRPHLSLITFRGHMAVHGLFDFLLEACGTAIGGGSASGGRSSRGGGRGGVARGLDVPLLLSRQPFLNASLKALKVRQIGPVHRSRATSSAADTSKIDVVELVGHVLPSAFNDLAQAMASICTADYTPCRRDASDRTIGSEGVGGADGGGQWECAKGHDDGVSKVGGVYGEGEDKRRGEALFRAVGSVDPDTSYLNAGFDALERRHAVGEERIPDGIGGRRGGCHCLESRCRVSLPSPPLARSGEGSDCCVAFDVCYTDPTAFSSFV